MFVYIPAQSFKNGLASPALSNGLTGRSDSGSSSSSSSDNDDVTDDEKDRASTLYGVDDMPETNEHKDESENEQVTTILSYALAISYHVYQGFGQAQLDEACCSSNKDGYYTIIHFCNHILNVPFTYYYLM